MDYRTDELLTADELAETLKPTFHTPLARNRVFLNDQ